MSSNSVGSECPIKVSGQNWPQSREFKASHSSTGANTREVDSSRASSATSTAKAPNQERATNHQRSCKLVRTGIEWVLMGTINLIAIGAAHFSRGRLKWSSYRKLGKCKSAWSNSASYREGNEVCGGTREKVSPTRTVECEDTRRKEVRRRGIGDVDLQHGCSDKRKQINSHKRVCRRQQLDSRNSTNLSMFGRLCIAIVLLCFINELSSSSNADVNFGHRSLLAPSILADASLIIGDSAIEIQEIGDSPANPDTASPAPTSISNDAGDGIEGSSISSAGSFARPPSLILGSTVGDLATVTPTLAPSTPEPVQQLQSLKESQNKRPQSVPAGPLPPIAGSSESSSTGASRPDNTGGNSDSDGNDHGGSLSKVLSAHPRDSLEEKAITGKVVDFELTPAGGHNKAKIKKKKKKKKKKESEEFKKWGKKKKSEKKASEKKHKESMKKKKEEGKKGKKNWGIQEKGQKKKGSFKKKKWGKKVKKGKGLKKGKKGKKFLKDKGHKNTGFKTVYHKEEWGKSSKWHDIKREKKWDEKSKKWKKKWKKEKGKKYKGDHMKKFEKKKKSGKKYKKEKKEKFKKSKKEEFKKGKKEKMEEHGKKKEGGSKKEMKAEKKKKKKKG